MYYSALVFIINTTAYIAYQDINIISITHKSNYLATWLLCLQVKKRKVQWWLSVSIGQYSMCL
jgi:hypothetical protein